MLYVEDTSKIHTKSFCILKSFSLFRSQYFDDDGDLAHEFYEEHIIDDKPTMLRSEESSLKHQGRIKYRTPRLHYDFPSVILSN